MAVSTTDSGLNSSTFSQNGISTASYAGLISGLILTALLVFVATVGCIIRRRTTHMSQSELPEALPKAEETTQYITNARYVSASAVVPPSTAQSPIYENVDRGFCDLSPNRRCNPVNSDISSTYDDDPYMKCDQAEEAIYSNDPSFLQHSSHFNPNVEDEYVTPDAL